jgi:hypothetical protein
VLVTVLRTDDTRLAHGGQAGLRAIRRATDRLTRGLEPPGQPGGDDRRGRAEQVEHVAELVRAAAPGIGDVLPADLAYLAEQPDPVGVLALSPGHPPQVGEVPRVHGEDQVIPGQPGRVELPSPVRLRARAVVAPAGQRLPRVRIHRVADVPVPGTRAVHDDRAVRQAAPSSARSTVSAIGDRQMLPGRPGRPGTERRVRAEAAARPPVLEP